MKAQDTKRRAAVVVVKKEGGQYTILARKVDQLAKDAAKLHEPKTVASLQRQMAKVLEDVKNVQALIDKVTHDAGGDAKHDAAKVVHTAERSTIVKPVEFARKFLDKNPGLSRKDAINTLWEKGVNYSTARTQYQKWYKEQHA